MRKQEFLIGDALGKGQNKLQKHICIGILAHVDAGRR